MRWMLVRSTTTTFVAARDVDVANVDVANAVDDVNTKTIDNNVNKGFY